MTTCDRHPDVATQVVCDDDVCPACYELETREVFLDPTYPRPPRGDFDYVAMVVEGHLRTVLVRR